MKHFYFTFSFFIVSLFLAAQNNDSVSNQESINKSSSIVTAVSTSAKPTGTSTEVGTTEGSLTVSLNGNANYSLPIYTPPGINGFEPQISISYNSHRGLGGNAALGWDITGVSSITRIPATKFHDGTIDAVDFNSLDRFALDGQRLIVKTGSSAAYGGNNTVYETEYYSNTKVTSYGVHPNGASFGPAYFIVEYPNGTKAYYGSTADSKSVTEWSISYMENAQGARISYQYTLSDNTLFISSIKYGALGVSTPINEINFTYGKRSSIDDFYIGGLNVKRDKNLIGINVIGSSTAVRNYVFELFKDQILSVTEKTGDNSKSYNPTVFKYNAASWEELSYLKGNNLLDVGNITSLNAATISSDFNGDGNMDFILYQSSGSNAKTKYWVYSNTNPKTPFSISIPHNIGMFDEIFPVTYLTSDNKVSAVQGWTVVNQSGFTTFALNSNNGISQKDQKTYAFQRFVLDYEYECENSLLQQSDSLQSVSITKKIPGGGPVHYERDIPRTIVSGDFNGDGLTDIAIIEKSFTYPYRYGCSTLSRSYKGKTYFVNLDKRITSNYVTAAGSIETTDYSIVRTADFNGDGKSDIFVFDTGKVKIYSLNDDRQFVLLYQTVAADANIILDRPILMGDFNGDGKTDFMTPEAYNSRDWYRYTSTGKDLLKKVETTGVFFIANNPYTTYNYIAADFTNDNRTDIIRTKSSRNTENTSGSISVDCFYNQYNYFTTDGTNIATGIDPDINIYALPVYLPTSNLSLKYGTLTTSSTLQVAFLNLNRIHYFSHGFDLTKDNLLTNVITGDGVEEAITYVPLSSRYTNMAYSIYNPAASVASFPFLDIQIDPNLYVVSKLEQKSKDVYRKKLFGYYGAVSNMEGLGFIGFRSTSETNWHDDNTQIFTTLNKNNMDLRGAAVENVVVPYLTYPFPGDLPSNFISRSATTYNTAADDPLQSNKVFKLKTTNLKQFNTVQDINSEIKDIVYDADNNVKSSTALTTQGGALFQTEKTNTEYQPAVTTPVYILGRPANKTRSVTAGGITTVNKEIYTYNGQQLLTSTERSITGGPTITETNNLFDSFGNVKTKTISSGSLSRVTKYEYDTSGRFLTKITDPNLLSTNFEYYLHSGLIKKTTDPYGQSVSYTYDDWFKESTQKDDKLNAETSTIYTRNGQETIVTTTTKSLTNTSLDTGITEEKFDDLGRKTRSGQKNLNGAFSYTSYLYDIYDRAYKISEPYFGTSPTQWNETKYDIYSRPTNNTLFNARTISTSYNLLRTTTTDGQKIKDVTSNAIGNIVSSKETLGGTIDYTYFPDGNLNKASYNGINIVTEQNGWGHKTKLTDPSAGTYIYGKNDFGELTSETIQNAGITTTITRDPANGKVTKKIITGSGTDSETNYTYDGLLPLIITYIDKNEPAGTNTIITKYTYDSNYKRVTTIEEDKSGGAKFTRSFTYDALGRIATETKFSKLGAVESSVLIKNIYKNGDLYQILDKNDKVLWQANALNAYGQITESITGNGIKMINGYDSDGYLSKIQHDKTTAPAGNIITLTTKFNKNTDYLDNRTNSAFANYFEEFEYDELGRLKSFTNRLGAKETQTYDASGKISSNNLGTYDYDAVKKYQNTAINLTPEAAGYYADRQGIFNDSMEDKIGWGTEKWPNTSFFSYDAAKVPHAKGKNTLKLTNTTTTEQYLFSDKWVEINNSVPTQYTYSAWVFSDNPQSEIFLYMKDASNVVTQVNTVNNIKGSWVPITGTFLVPAGIKKLRLRLDNNGQGNVWYDDVEIRKTSDPTSNIRNLITTYNAFKSPLEIEETNVDKISFTYNDDNQRSTMNYGGFQTNKLRKHYSADGSMEIKQNTTTGALEFVTYIAGDGYTAPIAVKSDGTNQIFLYLHRDYQGSILAITDASGSIVEKRLFDAWGSIIKVQNGAGEILNGLTVLDRGYTGHEHIQSVGLINMNARLYDPLLRRFLQTDNYIQDITSTQNYNPYAYVYNNPLLYTDTTGNVGEFCEQCGGGGTPGVNHGGGSGISTDLGELGRDTGLTDFFKRNLNFNSWTRTWKKIFGGGDDKDRIPPPLPNMSRYANMPFVQGFGKMGVESILDSYNTVFPGIDKIYHALGAPKLLDLSPTNSQKTGYYTAMGLSLLIPGSAEAKVEQYSLRAVERGYYPVMKRGFRKAQELVWLEKDEVWKFGTTKNPFKRYSIKYLKDRGENGLYYFEEFKGTLSEALQVEKMKIMNYLKINRNLPPGNKIKR